MTQAAAAHWPDGHDAPALAPWQLPLAPQYWPLVCGLMHVPPQSTSPAGHAHAPLWHVSPPVHAAPFTHWPFTQLCGVELLHCCALPAQTSHTPAWHPMLQDDDDASYKQCCASCAQLTAAGPLPQTFPTAVHVASTVHGHEAEPAAPVQA